MADPPPNNYDFPNPRGYAPTQWRTHLDSFKLPLRGQDRQFGAAGETKSYDYPNPRAPTPGISLKTHTDSYKLPLTGKDAFFNGAGRGPVYDWPNPRGPIHNLDLKWWTNGFRINLLSPPFINYDFPNPRGYAPALWRTHTDSYKLTLLGKDKFFAGAGQTQTYDYPNPKGPVQNFDLKTWTQGFAPGLQPVQFPFAQYDWPVPRGYVPGTDLRTWIGTTTVFEFPEPFYAVTVIAPQTSNTAFRFYSSKTQIVKTV